MSETDIQPTSPSRQDTNGQLRLPLRNKSGIYASFGPSTYECIDTPPWLCRLVVSYFKQRLYGHVLEPYCGRGNLVVALQEVGVESEHFDIQDGKDFLKYRGHVDWIFTNPPWSETKAFLKHAIKVTDNIIMVNTVTNVLNRPGRMRLLYENGFLVKEVRCLPKPKNNEWPTSGHQVAAFFITRGKGVAMKWYPPVVWYGDPDNREGCKY